MERLSAAWQWGSVFLFLRLPSQLGKLSPPESDWAQGAGHVGARSWQGPVPRGPAAVPRGCQVQITPSEGALQEILLLSSRGPGQSIHAACPGSGLPLCRLPAQGLRAPSLGKGSKVNIPGLPSWKEADVAPQKHPDVGWCPGVQLPALPCLPGLVDATVSPPGMWGTHSPASGDGSLTCNLSKLLC